MLFTVADFLRRVFLKISIEFFRNYFVEISFERTKKILFEVSSSPHVFFIMERKIGLCSVYHARECGLERLLRPFSSKGSSVFTPPGFKSSLNQNTSYPGASDSQHPIQHLGVSFGFAESRGRIVKYSVRDWAPIRPPIKFVFLDHKFKNFLEFLNLD